VAAAGDIACNTYDDNYNGGLGTASACRQMATSNLLGTSLAAILLLGDNQYENGALSQFQQVFAPSWGRFKGLERPVAGNHEYGTPGATGYFDYFGALAGPRGKGWYSFDVGAWHLVALNSNCDDVGCGSGSTQEKWLRSDLAAHRSQCTLAYWHHPRFTSGDEGGGDTTSMSTIWTDLYNANADLVLVGHDHDYERFTPMNAKGQPDSGRGVREIVVGTGGKSHHSWAAIHAGSQARNNTTYGVLRLVLHPRSYDWRFLPEGGAGFTDGGSTACH
jgi:hypothetical protein